MSSDPLNAPPLTHDRRHFLGLAALGLATQRLPLSVAAPMSRGTDVVSASFPRLEPAAVEEMVRVAHNDIDRVRALLDTRPALARATIDWGFGDWEDALGAASHVGRYEIAELLIARGARPTIFSAAMMGQLDTVKAFVAAMPGCQKVLGPHSITLLAHARAGGARAAATRAWLEQLGDADNAPATQPLDPARRAVYAGTYAFGPSDNERLVVTADGATALNITRAGLPFGRTLRHVGDHAFFPAGADHVRVRFTVNGERATALNVVDGALAVTATRMA